MIFSALRLIDKLSFGLAFVGMGMILALVLAMVYEVIARYAFNAPTIWSYDVSYMLNGSLFILAGALTLARNNHVRIDFLSSRLPRKTQEAANFIFYVVLFLPGLGVAVWAAMGSAIDVIFSGEVEAVSPWAPVIWPFRLAIAVGLAALWLQALAETIRHGIGYFHPSAVRAPHEQIPH